MSKEAGLRRISSAVVASFVRAATRLRISPDALTLLGLGISLVSAAIVAAGHLLAGGVVMLFASLFDMLDGAVARSLGKSTKFGALIDSVSDRISEAALLGALLLLYTFRGSTGGVVLTLAALVGSFLTSYVRARAEGLGLDCRVGVLTRAERVIVLALGLMLDEVTRHAGAYVAVSVITLFSYVTIVQRLAHVWRQTKK